ncbi:MAG: hypothetical protein HY553_08380 [Elusimicrobia bacterium]|nr:hypothetical protein [Elusimicrobiota bacterium]
MNALAFFDLLRWLDGSPLSGHLEPYRRRLFSEALEARDPDGRLRYNLIVAGRAKKNWKSADLVLAALYALLTSSPSGNECYLLANDEDQAGDDLRLAKKLVAINRPLSKHLAVQEKVITRRDGRGFLQILPAKDVAGSHGKSYRFCGFDEVHEHRTWDLLEAMQLDPTRLDAQMWVTSYASVYHRPGVPLFDLCQAGWAGRDPRMLFSWYGGDRTTDPAVADADPETRANPSRGSWADPDYLAQQRRRLPAHKFRRLHLNLPGLPEGAAFQPEPVMDAVRRGVPSLAPEPGRLVRAFVDMSGGSNDDAVLALGWEDGGSATIARVLNQGPPPPFDPRAAVARFVTVLREYGVGSVTGDNYAGQTFKADFERSGITFRVADKTTHQIYEALEPALNSRRVILPDVPEVEQQLLGLVWRGGRIDHSAGEHDDWANAVAGLVVELLVAREWRCTVPGCPTPGCSGAHFFELGGSGVWDTGVGVNVTREQYDALVRESAEGEAVAPAPVEASAETEAEPVSELSALTRWRQSERARRASGKPEVW